MSLWKQALDSSKANLFPSAPTFTIHPNHSIQPRPDSVPRWTPRNTPGAPASRKRQRLLNAKSLRLLPKDFAHLRSQTSYTLSQPQFTVIKEFYCNYVAKPGILMIMNVLIITSCTRSSQTTSRMMSKLYLLGKEKTSSKTMKFLIDFD